MKTAKKQTEDDIDFEVQQALEKLMRLTGWRVVSVTARLYPSGMVWHDWKKSKGAPRGKEPGT